MTMNDVDSFIRVSVITKDNNLIHLDLVCSEERYCLWNDFHNIEDMEKYISDNIDDALKRSVRKIDDFNYILNCDTNEGGLIIDGYKWEKQQGEKIIRFMPVIKKFMVDAISGNLPIVEEYDIQKSISL